MRLGDLMTWTETVAFTAIPRSSLYAKIKAGEFPKPRAIGDRGVRFARADVEKWVSDRKIAAKTGHEAKPGRPPVRGESRRRRKSLSRELPERAEKLGRLGRLTNRERQLLSPANEPHPQQTSRQRDVRLVGEAKATPAPQADNPFARFTVNPPRPSPAVIAHRRKLMGQR